MMDRATADLKAIYSRRSAATDELHGWAYQFWFGDSPAAWPVAQLRASDAGIAAALAAICRRPMQAPDCCHGADGELRRVVLDSVDRTAPLQIVAIRID